MLRRLIGRVTDRLITLLPNCCKDLLIDRKIKRIGLPGAARAIAKAWRPFQYTPLEVPPRGPDPIIPATDL
jgi:hypothetical protein